MQSTLMFECHLRFEYLNANIFQCNDEYEMTRNKHTCYTFITIFNKKNI